MNSINYASYIRIKAYWRTTNKCKLCFLGPCMCEQVQHRQADGKGPYECEPAPRDEHMIPHDPLSEYRAERFISELREATRQSRIMRGCDPITGVKIRGDETEQTL